MFGPQPDHATLRAAGVVASWFGMHAGWRGARFPTRYDALPSGHAVVFVVGNQRPQALHDLPTPSGPAISVVTNPVDGVSKLLVVQGRTVQELKTAADGLVLATPTLSGQFMQVKEHNNPARAAYDVPNWVRTDRPMKLGELVGQAQDLQAFGHQPDTLRVRLRIPPDLFTWRSRGVPLDLKYRYTPPPRANESRLNMSVNDELVQAFNLSASGQGGESRVRLPLLDAGLLGEGKEVFIPAFKLGSRNELQFQFSFSYVKEGGCRDTLVESTKAMIDADSTLDFSNFPHYADMPHLGYFATSGYPFSRHADLSRTVAVLPATPTPVESEIFLALMGRMGEATGHPATHVRVVGPDAEREMQDADLLVIGTSERQPLLSRWAKYLPAQIDGEQRRIALPQRNFRFSFGGFGIDPGNDTTVSAQAQTLGNGPLAALLGFESPLTGEASVVVVTGVLPEHIHMALDAVDNYGLAKSMFGSTVFINGAKVDSFTVGDTYSVGYLPPWTLLWYRLSTHPILLGVMAVIAVLILAFALWRTLKVIATYRRRSGGDQA